MFQGCLFVYCWRVGLNEGGMPSLLDVQNFHHSHFWLYIDLLFCIWSKLMAGSLFSGDSSVFLYINSSYCFKMYKAECLCRPEQLQTFDVFASVFHPWCTAVASPPCFFPPFWHHHLSLHHCDTANLTWRVDRIKALQWKSEVTEPEKSMRMRTKSIRMLLGTLLRILMNDGGGLSRLLYRK